MPRAKKYLDVDVVQAARERLAHIYDIFDSCVVMWSGGKDSSAVLELAKQYHEQHDLGPVKVVFRHEEVINPSVLEFVEKFRHYDWMELHWFCIPMANSKFVLGRKERYIEWDPNREWVTEQPEWAITHKELGIAADGTRDQHSLDDLIAEYLGLKGKVAFITGVRAAESLVRFRAVTQKLNENYINNIEGNNRSRVKLCKPIYDWQQDDVLKFLWESGMEWCPLYESQELAGMGLRVSTALHVVASKKFDKMRAVEPEFYQKIVNIFPEMMDQERYWHEFDAKGAIRKYMNRGPDGILEYIEDNVPDENKPLALDRFELWRKRNANDPENYPWNDFLNVVAFGTINQRLAGRYVNSKANRRGKKNGK